MNTIIYQFHGQIKHLKLDTYSSPISIPKKKMQSKRLHQIVYKKGQLILELHPSSPITIKPYNLLFPSPAHEAQSSKTSRLMF